MRKRGRSEAERVPEFQLEVPGGQQIELKMHEYERICSANRLRQRDHHGDEEITAPVTDPVEVWHQFCSESTDHTFRCSQRTSTTSVGVVDGITLRRNRGAGWLALHCRFAAAPEPCARSAPRSLCRSGSSLPARLTVSRSTCGFNSRSVSAFSGRTDIPILVPLTSQRERKNENSYSYPSTSRARPATTSALTSPSRC